MPGSSLPSHGGSGDRHAAGGGRMPDHRSSRPGHRPIPGADPMPLLHVAAVPAPPRTVHEVSAGGVVLDDHAADVRVILLGRTGRRGRLEWILPKGHVEPGETIEGAAAREVREETGLTATIVGVLGDIDYWFVSRGDRVHKTVHHFVLRRTGGSLDLSDAEVTDLVWVPVSELTSRLRYASERRLAGRLAEVVPELASPRVPSTPDRP